MISHRSFFSAKTFYFFYYAAWACLAPFLALYYRNLGFTGRQIGLLASISPLTTLIAASFWGAVADASQRHRTVLLGAIAGAGISVFVLAQVNSFWLIIPIVISYSFFAAPIIPLVDNSVIAQLGANREQYGKQRLWGAIGWGLAGPLAGWLVGIYGISAAFPAYLSLIGMAFLASWFLNVVNTEQRQNFWIGVHSLLTDHRWYPFLLVVFLSGSGLSIITNYLFLYMVDLKATSSGMGLALFVATISEVPVLFFSSHMLRRWGPRGLMVISLSAYVIRAFGYSFAREPWQAVLLQLFHGLSFSAMWVAGVSFANQIAPKGLGATAQGLFASTAMGLGGISGAFMGGILLDLFGGAGVFRFSASAVFVGLVLFLIAGRTLSNTSKEHG